MALVVKIGQLKAILGRIYFRGQLLGPLLYVFYESYYISVEQSDEKIVKIKELHVFLSLLR